jgi:hypothetical protein
MCKSRKNFPFCIPYLYLWEREEKSTSFITTICFAVRNPLSSVFYSFTQPFSTYVLSINWWRFSVEDLMTYRDHIFVDFLPIYFLFREKASLKEYPGSRLLLPIKYGLDWRKKNGEQNYYVRCSIPYKLCYTPKIPAHCAVLWIKVEETWPRMEMANRSTTSPARQSNCRVVQLCNIYCVEN